MKRVVFLLLSIMLVISVTGCDSGLEIVGIEIEKYPNRIVYYAGVDTELDLSGGIINHLVKAKEKYPHNMVKEVSDHLMTVSHNIDFNRPGVYVVTLHRSIHECKFPIQVIDNE